MLISHCSFTTAKPVESCAISENIDKCWGSGFFEWDESLFDGLVASIVHVSSGGDGSVSDDDVHECFLLGCKLLLDFKNEWGYVVVGKFNVVSVAVVKALGFAFS